MDIDFRKPSIVSLKGFDPKKAGKRFFNKTWDQYVYTVCILVMAFTYVNQTLEEYPYPNYSYTYSGLLWECLLSSTGGHEVLIPHLIEQCFVCQHIQELRIFYWIFM